MQAAGVDARVWAGPAHVVVLGGGCLPHAAPSRFHVLMGGRLLQGRELATSLLCGALTGCVCIAMPCSACKDALWQGGWLEGCGLKDRVFVVWWLPLRGYGHHACVVAAASTWIDLPG